MLQKWEAAKQKKITRLLSVSNESVSVWYYDGAYETRRRAAGWLLLLRNTNPAQNELKGQQIKKILHNVDFCIIHTRLAGMLRLFGMSGLYVWEGIRPLLLKGIQSLTNNQSLKGFSRRSFRTFFYKHSGISSGVHH